MQHGVVAAFVLAAQNNQDASGKSFERLLRGVHVGGFRIVVITHPANFSDELEAMLDSSKRAHALGDGRRPRASKGRCGYGCQNVFDVVRAGQGNIAEFEDRFLHTFVAKQNVAFLRESALGHTLLPAEPIHLRLCGGIGRCARVIRIQHRAVRFRLVLENSRLGGTVTLECVMAVQMIGREIQEHADVWLELFDKLQLKAAEFRNSDGVFIGLFDAGNQGRADVARQNRGETRVFQNVLDQRSRCRFSIRTGNPDEPPFQKAVRQLDLAPHCDAFCASELQQG